VDGLVINTTGKNNEYIADLSKEIPIILVNRKIKDLNKIKCDFIDSDNNQGCYSITLHLLSNGHRKIGVINGPQDISTGVERYEGFKRAMNQFGITVDKDYKYQFFGDFTMESGYQGTSYLMSLVDKPTAILAMNNATALGVLKYTRIQKISIPEELSLASYGNIENIELLYVKPSIVTLDPWMIGNKVGEMIIERINDNEQPNRSIIYVPSLEVGDGVKII
jgi:LacI family transcriptional regulator